MTAYTYQALEGKIESYFVDSDTEFKIALPGIISQGEARVYGDLDLDTTLKTDFIIRPPITNAATLPTNCISPQELRYTDNTGPLIKERTVAFVNTMQREGEAGDPLWWAPLTTTSLIVAPAPLPGAGTEFLWIRHSAPEEQLDPNVPDSTTWISRVFGDLLLMSCLWAAETFNKHVEGETARANQYGILLAQTDRYLVGRKKATTRV